MKDFISSFSFDKRLAIYDIIGSIAYASMLGKFGIISKEEEKKIINGLESIKRDITKKKKLRKAEDIHYSIENELIKRIGKLGGKLHTGRSRNDQVSLDMRLYLREEISNILKLLSDLEIAFINQAEENIDIVIPGYTHLQHAQPVLLSHHLLAYVWMLRRDRERLAESLKRVNTLPIGSGAIAGTDFYSGEAQRYIAKLLGFKTVSQNSIDAVSDRDFIIEFMSDSSILMMHLSRLAEEIILWNTEEFKFVELPSRFTTGSSIMPQKRNPDYIELVKGKTGRVYGNLFNILTTMKGLALSYNRDMQEDKVPLFDTVDTVKSCLKVMASVVSSMKFLRENIRKSLNSDLSYILSTEIVNYLVKKNLPFREAHSLVKKILRKFKKEKLKEFQLEDLKKISNLFGNDAKKLFDLKYSIESKKTIGSTSTKSVKKQISILKRTLRVQI